MVPPATFAFPTSDTKVWHPLRFDPQNASVGSFNYEAIGRLKPGVSPASATAELDRILPLVLDEVQLEGKARMSGAAFWRDFQVKQGERVE